jgi:spore maturation protein SpmA
VLNKIWVAFFLVGFVAAVVQLLQGDLDVFTRVLNGLFVIPPRPVSTFRSAWSAS